MFFTISFPLIDKREFLDAETHRIDASEFPRGLNDGSFLRSFGMYGLRSYPDANIPPHEKVYANAHRGVRIAKQQQLLRFKKEWLRPSCIFRRVFFDNYSARVDIGLRVQDYLTNSLYPSNIIDKIEAILKYKMYVPPNPNNSKKIKDLGKEIANKYLYATTKDPGCHWKIVNPNWISHACPIVIVEVDQTLLVNGKVGNEKRLKNVSSIPSAWGVQLYHYMRSDGIPAWIIVKGESLQKDKLRALRIFLLRFHQEKEALKSFPQLVASAHNHGWILNVARIEHFLNKTTSYFSKARRDGVEQQPIVDIVKKADIIAYGPETQYFLDYLGCELPYLKERCRNVMNNVVFNAPFNGIYVGGDNNGKIEYENNTVIPKDSVNDSINKQEVYDILKKLEKLIPEESTDRNTFKKEKKQLSTEIKKKTPNKEILKKALDSLSILKAFAEAGTILAALAKALGLFPTI